MALEAPPYGIAPWHLNPTNTITEPDAGEFRADEVTAPTAFAVSETDRLGNTQEADLFAELVAGDRLVLQQMRSAGRYLVFDVGIAVDHGTWWELPVTMIGSTATLVDGQDYLWVFRHVAAPPSWVTADDVLEAVGIPADADWLQAATDAANAWAFRRRAAAGYFDNPDVSPGPDVDMGVVLLAKSLYAQRGAVDGFDSYQQLEGFVPSGTLAEVRMMLGIGRPTLSGPPADFEVAARRRLGW